MTYDTDKLFTEKGEFADGVSYISVYKFEDDGWKEQSLSWFKQIVDVNVSKRHKNYYGNQDTGAYDISFTLKSEYESDWTIVYKFTNDDYDSNENQFVIEKAKLEVIWGNLSFDYNEDGNYPVNAQLASTSYDEPLAIELEITQNGIPVTQISEAGSYLVTARLVNDYGNFEILNATQIIVVKAPEIPQNSDNGLPVWVIALIAAGAGLAVIIAVIAIVIVMKKKKAKAPAAPQVVYRDVNSDNEGFYDDVTNTKNNDDDD